MLRNNHGSGSSPRPNQTSELNPAPPAISLSEPEGLAAVEGELTRAEAPARAGPDILEHLRRLPPDHRAAVTMFYLEERSEAAAALGVSMGTVKTWLHRDKWELAARIRGEVVKS